MTRATPPPQAPPSSAAQLIEGAGLVSRRLRVQDSDVVWLRAVVEAYDGLAQLHGDGSGTITLTTTSSLAPELDRLIDQVSAEISLQRLAPDQA